MGILHISKRKIESYKRAEVVAQALRKHIAKGPRATHDGVGLLVDFVIDWMEVTGNLKYEDPVRRSKKDRSI